MTIQNVKTYWNNGYITLMEARKFSKELGYNMANIQGKWVWFKR